MRNHRRRRVVRALAGLGAVALGMGLGAARGVQGTELELSSDPEISDTGHYRLSWEGAPPGAEVLVQEASDADFSNARILYEGSDGATVITGRLDGVFHYRARAEGGPWSAPVTVTVRHHSLEEALFFLALGGAVFLATAVLIVAGHRRHRREMGGTS